MSSVVNRPLTPDLLPDWVAFFDHQDFSDNPSRASCCCHLHSAGHSASAWENHSSSSELIRAARLRGHRAYAGEEPIGWCNANAHSSIPNLEAGFRVFRETENVVMIRKTLAPSGADRGR